ncbi:MAG: hypothetical protein A2583_13255 [Bdellovibrionales bacterium RIFOXYD1_FULL_53_11]|nr:MAG: hypothetical protein A2583_13255 [Bdellovibrionales bacterium RIFOXYD1_FULL_53_11]
MALNITVVSTDGERESVLAAELSAALGTVADVFVQAQTQAAAPGQIIFIDGSMDGLDERLGKLDRRGRAVFIITGEADPLPQHIVDGIVDDLIVRPFRRLDAVSKLGHYKQILMWEEVSRLNASFSELIEGLHEDLRLAERLQKSKLPVKFPDVKGFNIACRYLAGLRSGGDYFDLAESRDGSRLSMMLSDSSSYGLSSAVLSVLMRVAMKLSVDETRSCYATVRAIRAELGAALGSRDRLSLFYGVMSRKDYVLSYLNLGSSCAFHRRAGRGFVELPSQGEALAGPGAFPQEAGEAEIALEPSDRLVLVSDGFVEAAGGTESVCGILERFKDSEPADTLNELVYLVKSGFKSEDDMPAQDCTAMVFDVDSRVVKLVRH